MEGCMAAAQLAAGRAGIALWHVLSGLLDYSILKSIYFSVPELAAKKRRRYESVAPLRPLTRRPYAAEELRACRQTPRLREWPCPAVPPGVR
jgi:hypothetical protein